MTRISTLLTKTILGAALLFGSTNASAQTTETKQVIVATSGQFGNPQNYVRIGAYNPKTKVYTVFDSVQTTSVRSILVEENFAYVAADTLLIKYNLENNTRIAIDTASGLNTPGGYMALYDDYILATRGFGATANYLVGYNKSDLKQAFVIGGISDQAAGIIVYGDTAYVAVAGAFNKNTGSIAVVDLKNKLLKREINLDTLGAGINRIFLWQENIYTVNSKHSTISQYNIESGALSHKKEFYAGTSGSGVELYNGKLFADFGYQGIGTYDVAADSIAKGLRVSYNKIPGVSSFANSVSASAYDMVNNHFYVAATNYISTGETYIFDANGDIIDTFSVGVAPEAIAMQYILTVGGIADFAKTIQLKAYPNPAKNALYISANELNKAQITVSDISGKTFIQQNVLHANTPVKVDVQSLPQGVYIVSVRSAAGLGFVKFIKQ